MRIPRVHLDLTLAVDATVDLPDTAARHLQRVLRLRPGDEVVLFDGAGGEYPSRLERGPTGSFRAHVLAREEGLPEAPLRIALAQGISRGERMDLVVQKAVELGVHTIQPLITERSVVKLDARRAASRLAHWRGIATAACEQCGRTRLPAVEAVRTLDEWLAAAHGGTGLVLDPRAGVAPSALPAPEMPLRLLIGPEGGLSPAEHARAREAGLTPVRLGPRVLRTETAAIVGLAAVQLLWGDLGR